MNYKLGFRYFSLIALMASLLLIGCEKKETPEDQKEYDTLEVKTSDSTVKVPMTDSVVVKEDSTKDTTGVQKPKTGENLMGTWSGSLAGYKTTLKINKVDGESVTGKITISYRAPVTQTVKGKYNAGTGTLTLRDQENIRSAGSYSGKIIGKKYSGTFTTNVEKAQSSFNLTKK